MTGEGASLSEDVTARIERKKREAIDAELRLLEEKVAAAAGDSARERRERLDRLAEARTREAEEASVRELADLQAFGEQTLRLLDAERDRRREARLADETRRREERLRKEQKEEERKRAAEEEARKRKASAEDPAVKVRAILRHAQSHLQRGDHELAARTIAEGLEIDGFNAELLDLDAKVREAMASDTFSAGPAPSPEGRKEKAKGKAAKAKAPKAKPEKKKAAPSVTETRGARKVPAWVFTVVAALLISVAGLIAWLEYRPKPVERGMTIAVLPWTAPSSSPDLRLFADALPELVVRRLVSSPSASGILGYATTSNLASLGRDPVSPLVRLGFSHFLRGTLSKPDSMFSLRVELSDSAGAALWSAEYRRDTAGLVLATHEIVHGLRTWLREEPGRPEGTAIEVRNAGAYTMYLAGLNALRMPGGQGIDSAIGAFREATLLDSMSGESFAGLATAIAGKRSGRDPGPDSLLREAHDAASRAIGLAPRSGDAYLAMARVYVEQRRFQQALGMLDSASRFAPGDGRIHWCRALALFRSGQPQPALEAVGQAYRLDPRNADILGLMGTIHQVNKSFERALWCRETAMFFGPDTLRYVAGPLSDVIMLDPTLVLSQSQRVTSACLKLLEGDPWNYTILYSLARMLQVSGDLEESLTYFNGLETSLRAKIRETPGDTRAKMYLALTLTRLGRYRDGTALGEAAVAADTSNVEAKYLLARIYALQMYSPQTKTVEGEKQARALELLRQAVGRRFVDAELCSADLYNVYYQADIRSAIE